MKLEPIYLNKKKCQKVNSLYTFFFFIPSCISGENNSWFGSHVSSRDRCQPNDTEYFPIFILGKLKEDHMLCRRA